MLNLFWAFTIPYYITLRKCMLPYVSTLGILRYKVDFQSLQADEPLEDVDLDDY